MTLDVDDTQIVITNKLTFPFCADGVSVGTACTDGFDGFAFTFSSGVDITGVTVDPASAADFRPNDKAPHNGIQLISPTYFLVDVTGAHPAVGDQLILDIQTAGSTTPTIPEPSWAMMLVGFAGLGFVAYRRTAGHAPAG